MKEKTRALIKKIGVTLIIWAVLTMMIAVYYDAFKIPEREIPISENNPKEYVGGDAYNLIIEASIRGNEIAAGEIKKTIYYVVAIVLGLTGNSLFLIGNWDNRWKQIQEEKRRKNVNNNDYFR